MTKAQIVASCKLACRIASTTTDAEFGELVDSAFLDLENSGISDTEGNPYSPSSCDALVLTAVKTYVKLHFGDLLDNANAQRLEEAYWNQKAQLKMRVHSDPKTEES